MASPSVVDVLISLENKDVKIISYTTINKGVIGYISILVNMVPISQLTLTYVYFLCFLFEMKVKMKVKSDKYLTPGEMIV